MWLSVVSFQVSGAGYFSEAALKGEHWAPCLNKSPLWYVRKIVESDVKSEQTTTLPCRKKSETGNPFEIFSKGRVDFDIVLPLLLICSGDFFETLIDLLFNNSQACGLAITMLTPQIEEVDLWAFRFFQHFCYWFTKTKNITFLYHIHSRTFF